MASWAARPIQDEEVGLLPTVQENVEENRRRWRFATEMVAAVLIGFCLGCVVSWHTRNLKFSWNQPTEENEYPLNFLVVGDWGREGAYNQTKVAEQMGRVGRQLGIEFVISVGDNFYQHGLTGPHDPKFAKSFSNVYTADSLQTQWFAVLGNHDYLGDTLAQLGSHLHQRDERWFCQRSYQLQQPLCAPAYKGNCDKFVEFFFIDTTPFVDAYWIPVAKRTFDWRGIGDRAEYLKSQLEGLSFALENSTATWKIVVGHHTIRSLGRHGDTMELVDQVLPILDPVGKLHMVQVMIDLQLSIGLSHNVDMYINGHDHCLEYIKRTDSDVHFITSGGGSKSFQGLHEGTEEDGLQFGHDGQGFISVSMAAEALHIQFHDALGNTLHHLDLKK